MGNSKDSISGVFKIWIIASWYFSNISILFLNKYLLTNNGFKRPIFLTMCHMTACSLPSYVAITWMKMVPMQKLRLRMQFLKMAALWVVFCISVVSGNVSLQYLPLSFTQAVRETSPFCTALFAFLVTAKQEAWTTYATLIPVIIGMVMANGVLGNAKGVLAAVLSICIFKNQTTVKGFLGHVLTVIGAVLYHEANRGHERSSIIG